tara:strand:- start:140 stop:688 length:549 start_codon:yes stop_codon:yes gene_type:complete
MSVSVSIGKELNKPKQNLIRLELNIRKALNGDLMIFDHGDIDIVLSPDGNKIVTFAKENMSDTVYGAQNRLFTFLRKKGVIVPESVQAGNVYGSMEAVILESVDENLSSSKIALLNISKFIDDERPYFEFVDSIVDEFEDDMTDPENIDSTDLGDVEHSVEKGSIRKGYVRDPYSLSYLYTI